MKIHTQTAAAAAVALALAGAAGAQDISGEPYYGSTSLSAGFVPDPHSLHIGAGGSTDASTLGGGCVGNIGGPPDYNLSYDAGSSPLYITAASNNDVSLVINSPDGSWHCDDDSAGGLNAGITFASPKSGLYNIWVGRFGDSDLVDATLHISEIGYFDTLVDGDDGATTDVINAGAPPTYGDVRLTAGFVPDPHAVTVVPGGSLEASSVDSSCSGMVAGAPDYDLYYTSGATPLHIYAQSDSDTTLLVNTPTGGWVCDDDSGDGLNPSITFDAPQSGLYDIWVGSFGSAGGEATLYISEISGSGGGSAAIDISADPYFGSVALTGGFVPDPYTVEITPGGSADASSADSSCAGSVGTAPDFNLTFTPGGAPLFISAESGQDTTLLVNLPDGSWRCDDDGAADLNPGLVFKSPQAGLYNIWVGVFGDDEGTTATLKISEEQF